MSKPLDHFQFVIKFPLRETSSSKWRRTCVVYTKAPILCQMYTLSSELDNDKDRLRLVKAELKMALVKAIMDGEWEIEHE